jgi:prepilin-type N-terminal cleavage/methylation domain-containing protein
MRLIIRNNHGFTWIELIVVMVIMGIMSAFVAVGFMGSDTELATQTEIIKTHLRYAQSRSMNSNTAWYIQFSSNAYSLYKSGDAVPKLLPGGDSPTVTLPSGMNITSGTVSFDDWGKPCIDTAEPPTAQATDRTITVSDGSGSRDIIITKNTGFIQ